MVRAAFNRVSLDCQLSGDYLDIIYGGKGHACNLSPFG
jgi:hypothetical protein